MFYGEGNYRSGWLVAARADVYHRCGVGHTRHICLLCYREEKSHVCWFIASRYVYALWLMVTATRATSLAEQNGINADYWLLMHITIIRLHAKTCSALLLR